jgi:hypothetical protein
MQLSYKGMTMVRRGDGMELATGRLLAFRVPAEAIRRADALRPRVARDPSVAAVGRITRSAILRMALMKGLEALEVQYGRKRP